MRSLTISGATRLPPLVHREMTGGGTRRYVGRLRRGKGNRSGLVFSYVETKIIFPTNVGHQASSMGVGGRSVFFLYASHVNFGNTLHSVGMLVQTWRSCNWQCTQYFIFLLFSFPPL